MCGIWPEVYVDWDALAGVLHLLIGLGRVLPPGRCIRYRFLASENAPQAFDAAAVSSLARSAPAFCDTGLDIATAHAHRHVGE